MPKTLESPKPLTADEIADLADGLWQRALKLAADSGPVCRFCGYHTASPFTLYVPFGM